MNPVPFSSSSNESTPTPTGFRKNRNGYSSQRKQNSLLNEENQAPLYIRVFTSNYFYYGFSVLSLLLIIAFSSFAGPVFYCQQSERFYCEECPPNWNCTRTEKTCPSNDTFQGQFCIAENSTEQIALGIYDVVKEQIAKSTSFNNLREMFKGNETITPDVLTVAGQMCGYSLKGDHFTPITPPEKQQLLVLVALILCLIMYAVSFALRRKYLVRYL